MQILSQTSFTKRVRTQRDYKVKQRCWTILNFEEKMRCRLRQAWPFQHSYILREVWDTHRRTGEHLCVYKAYTCILFFKWLIVSLDKTLIHRLVSFIALWSCTETVILTFNRLESIKVHSMDTHPGMFSSKTLLSPEEKIHKHLGWHGVSKLSGHFFWKCTNPFRASIVLWDRVLHAPSCCILHI